MTQPIPSETIEYERYVDGLRTPIKSKKEIVIASQVFMGGHPQKPEITVAREKTLPKTITIHVEGGLVQDVTGIPAGYEVRVEDRDEGDTSHPSWDAEKGCFVTIYGEGAE